MPGIDEFTKLLIRANPPDAGTDFEDVSSNAFTITANGDAQVDTDIKKFVASILLDGNDDLSVPYNADICDFDEGDFTLETWAYSTAENGDRSLMSAGGYPSGWALYLYGAGGTQGVGFACNSGGWAGRIAVADKISLSTWTHIALVREGNYLMIFYDGVLKARTEFTGIVTSGNSSFIFGRERTFYVQGNYEEVRVSKGIARWTGTEVGVTYFTPPTTQYTEVVAETILSDAHIYATNLQETILSDAYLILSRSQETIQSNTNFYARIQQTITAAASFLEPLFSEVINKVNLRKQIISNILNKINLAILNRTDISNAVNIAKRIFNNISNDIRLKKRNFGNVLNDIRVIKSWQTAAIGGFQSLGKEYLKVYINSVEQTDVDVDSIAIRRGLNVAHAATFVLARAYDSTKPSDEAAVEIKYYNWILFSGYITQIQPGDTPESMLINCQDEYWKQNRTNVYYQVGHKPTDNQELFYEKISTALSTVHSLNWNIGDFVPQVIDNFSVGSSEAITNLITQCGNYGWYYDVNKNKKLWTAERGPIISISRQTLGNNFNLYEVVSHSFTDDVENIVNKLRVQMGNKVIRKFSTSGAQRSYTVYQFRYVRDWCAPAWNISYEHLAKDSDDGQGFDFYDPNGIDAEGYSEVFKVWNLPFINRTVEQWVDRYQPEVWIYNNFLNFINLYTSQEPVLKLTEGFTIDYDNNRIIFNEPLYLVKLNSRGEVEKVKAPGIKIVISKRSSFTYTESPSDDPESDITNPLMFFTNKVGDYATTIIKELALTDLSIQEGGNFVNANGETELIPSWDDTEFAEDIAYWNLSNSAYKKISGTVDITLDAFVFYNIQLNNRIYIEGITESAMNITEINFDMQNFIVRLSLENSHYYKRTVSLPSHGE